MSKIQTKISKLNSKVKKNQNKLTISLNEERISLIIAQFETLENLAKKFESMINLFMKQISLKAQFLITMNIEDEELYMEPIFTRNEKEQVVLDNLTTPEKVFFVIIFFLSIQILNDSKHVIFSNLLIPNYYNKRGSIERTIKKITPLLNEDARFSDIKLILILANLDLKSDFNNIKVIKIEKR
jgi:hypothetical protein